MSPNVLDTESLPGKTLKGPSITWSWDCWFILAEYPEGDRAPGCPGSLAIVWVLKCNQMKVTDISCLLLRWFSSIHLHHLVCGPLRVQQYSFLHLLTWRLCYRQHLQCSKRHLFIIRTEVFTNKEAGDCTRSTFVKHIQIPIRVFLNGIYEVVFSVPKPVNDRLSWIVRKLWISDYELMQVISKEIGTRVTTMPIKNSEECAFRPVVTFLTWWLHYVENNRYSIFVVVSDYALVGVCWVTTYDPIFAHWAFCLLKVWKLYCVRIGVRNISKQQSIDIHYIGRLRTSSVRVEHDWSLRYYGSLVTA
jgi:hypothetical protein